MNIIRYANIALRKLVQMFPFALKHKKSSLNECINPLRLRSILDVMDLRYRFDREEQCFIGEFDPDENFPKDISILIFPEPNRIITKCFVPSHRIENIKLNDVLLFCNKWNAEKLYPKAYIEPYCNLIIAESTMMLDNNSQDEFIRDAILRNTLSATWQFFVEMNRQEPVISKNI